MKTIAYAGQKGGTGKTTLALNCGVLAESAGEPVLLVDADAHGGLSFWRLQRGEDRPVVSHLGDRKLADLVERGRTSGAAWCMIDTPAGTPERGGVIECAIDFADYVVLTSKPNLLDIRTVRPTVDAVRAAGTSAGFVLNEVPVRGSTADAARTALAGYDLPCCPMAVAHRAAVAYSVLRGQAVNEYARRDKAVSELEGVWHWIRRQIDG